MFTRRRFRSESPEPQDITDSQHVQAYLLQDQQPQQEYDVPLYEYPASTSYQMGQPLETIMTGETLQIDNTGTQHPYENQPMHTGDSMQQYYSEQDYYAYDANQYGTNALPAGSNINHFHYDTEAYASGTFSRLSVPPRSRSPTPAVDDEDYHVVDDTSVHYTGSETIDSQYTGEDSSYYTSAASHYTGQDVQHEGQQPHSPAQNNNQANFFSRYINQNPFSPEKTSYFGNMQRRDSQQDSSSSGSYLEPLTPLETRHFGPAPTGRALRRHKTKKRVRLTNGNLMVDLAIPPKLVLPRKGGPEMMLTRYTAVTCDPDDFERSGFYLRQNETGRRTELFIVVTMYNEDEIMFCRTMYAVMQNIAHLTTRKHSQTWGPDAWKKVVVCIVADGRKKVHPRVLDCLTLLGVYQAGDHMKSGINQKEVTAHLFEYTTTFGLDADLKFKFPDKGVVPTQIIFCMKEKNQKKINSHRWFFNAFAPLLQPNVCVLLDVGTMPGKNSIYKLWKTFDLNSNVGGACGEMAAYKGKIWSELLNPLVAAQNFEYKIAGILDKPTESLFGYITVLPGAFSAYRYIALQNDQNGKGPLASYFKGEVLHGYDTDIFTSNMYLAEDVNKRILCFELVAKANCDWILKYVRSALAETDVPDALPEFISQRRRWLNGSFFAATYAIAHVGQIMRSGHSTTRKVMLFIETGYNVLNLIASWFSLGNFYVFFVILTSSLEDPAFHMSWIQFINTVVQYLMGSIVVACFLFSMGNHPRASKWKYKIASIILAGLMVYLLFASVMCSIAAVKQGGSANSVMVFSIIITFGLYGISSLLALDPWHMITSFMPYMLLSPTYINILSIYAFANLDDISWGTKQDDVIETDLGAVVQDSQQKVEVEMVTDTVDVNAIYSEAIQNLKYRKPVNPKDTKTTMSEAEREQKAKDYYASVKTNVMLLWVLSNGILLVGIIGGGDPSKTFTPGSSGFNLTKGYLTFILAFTALSNIIRFASSTLYLLTVFITG